MQTFDYFPMAISSLRPGAAWSASASNYNDLVWLDSVQTKPTEEEVNAEMARLQAQQPFEDCKAKATGLLYETDWTTIPDVANPENNPYLTNQAEFIAWRNEIRKLAVNPLADPVFPPMPSAIWSS